MCFDGIVMPALVAGIHAFRRRDEQDVDGRNKSGHDACVGPSKHHRHALGHKAEHHAVAPASTVMTVPAMLRALSLRRNSTVSATSPASARRWGSLRSA